MSGLEAGVLVGLNCDVENREAWVIVEDNDDAAIRLIADIVDASR